MNIQPMKISSSTVSRVQGMSFFSFENRKATMVTRPTIMEKGKS